MEDDDFTSSGGMTAQHAAVPRGPYRVAPTDGSERFNAIRIPLVPVACWRLNDPAFAFDSSFVSPDFAPELSKLASLVDANPNCPASLFAHADPVGSDAVNKHISDRRAIAIYAVLTRQMDKWEELYSNPIDGDTWGTRTVQTMLATLKDANDLPYYRDGIDGENGPNTTHAVKRFQGDAGLAADGNAGAATRKVLFGAYMDAVCSDASGHRFTMKPEDFLGGGADPGGKMAMQGCSRFNPVVLLPAEEEADAVGPRDADNASNRRVLVFLFRPRATAMSEWPCPRVKEPADACKSQFWPDGDQRRKPGDALRLYEESRDTIACRFYDRFARRSPCEGGVGIPKTFNWVAQPPASTEGLTLLVRASDGSLLRHEPVPSTCTGPGDCTTFSLDDLRAGPPVEIELASGDEPLFPVVRVRAAHLGHALRGASLERAKSAFVPVFQSGLAIQDLPPGPEAEPCSEPSTMPPTPEAIAE